MRRIRQILFTLAKSPLASYFVSWILAHMSFIIPVHRLRQTDTLFAFHHPKPSYPIHILLVPKRPLKSVMALKTADSDFLIDLFQTVQSLVVEFDLEQTGYRLIVNGGSYQDVPHLHFHLITE